MSASPLRPYGVTLSSLWISAFVGGNCTAPADSGAAPVTKWSLASSQRVRAGVCATHHPCISQSELQHLWEHSISEGAGSAHRGADHVKEKVEENSMGVGAGFKGGRMPSTMHRAQRLAMASHAYRQIFLRGYFSYSFPVA